MRVWLVRRFHRLLVAGLTSCLLWPCVCAAQQASASTLAAGKALTVERVYSQPSLSGRMTRGLAWTPDGKLLTYFETKGAGRDEKTELWAMDTATGERRVLIGADKLESIMPAETARQTQATGAGRRPPSQYQWAPDGTAILFQGPTALAWLELKSQAGRTLVSGKSTITDPKISPDGKYVSFVRDHNLWAVNVADGKERAITRGGTEEIRTGELDWVYPEELDAKTGYWWSPDSSAIAYMEMDERKVSQYPLVEFASPSGEAEMERYPVAGGANPVVSLHVVSMNGGEARTMDIGPETDIYIPRVNWLRDSKHLAIQRLNRTQTALELLIAEAGTGKTKTILRETDPNWINVHDDLYFLKDGKGFLWSSEKSGYRHLYLYDLDGKELSQITKGQWEVTGLDAVVESGGFLFFTATKASPLERQLYVASMNGERLLETNKEAGQSGARQAEEVRLTKEPGTHTVNFSPNGGAFYDTFSNTATPPRQMLYRADGSLVAAINENKIPELDEYHLSPMEFLTVKTHDGVSLTASMIKPPNFDPQRKYPVLVYTYGGPHAQVVRNSWGGANFLWHELMAQKGYIIFSVDNRGSTGRGHAFETPLHLRLGAQEISDQRDGVAYLKSLPYVDGNRIGVWGWSYGGHMTLHLMFEAGGDFKVGFAGGPVTDWHYYDSIYTERYLGLPQQNEKGYEDSSPVKYASQLKGKLMIAHGTGDDNVHYANTLSLINSLIDAGKYVEVLAFPGRGHGVSDPAARKVLMQRVAQYFLDNL